MYIVTGGAGFIGSHIVHRLVAEGKQVTVVDNLFSGNEGNLADISGKFKFLKGNSGSISQVIEKPEAVIHQGVYSSSPMYKENPFLTAKAIEDMVGVLEYCRAKDCKLVFASSSSLYNDIEPPQRETARIKVTDYYTEARYTMERLAELYAKLYGVHIIALRYFSIYGEREHYKGKYANLISQFLWEMKKGQQPLVFGDGKQTRDFVYVEDVVDANILAAKSRVRFGIFNIGTGREISINDMVGVLNNKLGTSIAPTYKENTIKNYVARTQADTSKTEKKLGFKAKTSLEDGIGKLVEYYKDKRV
ncbi:MAG: NAD-dependent epimerase/dehydratase family protein [Candidatus Micrarchaeota archaeon]|nr:NAD-dependent epimerase/dehydratase family protein [Candidatus Micrarchaeota archaeon]